MLDNRIQEIDGTIAKGYGGYTNNIQEIGIGESANVLHAKWNNIERYLALNYFFNLNDNTINEIVHEFKLLRDVDFHNNVIQLYRIYGITKFEPENCYLLVTEYADGGSLRNYLMKSFGDLEWYDKHNIAYQLVCAVSWLQNDGIVHRDLHSGYIQVS